jgi:hypothetical protein
MGIDVSEEESVRNILTELRDQTFDGSIEQLALALGRPVEEIEGVVDGTEPLDEDLEMKARELADHRGVELDAADESVS